jgi:hypothetical protein
MFLNPICKAEFLRRQKHDLVIVFRLEDRIDDRLVPLQRPIRSGATTLALELRAARQQVGAVLAFGKYGPRGRDRVHHYQQIDLLESSRRLRHARKTARASTCSRPPRRGTSVPRALSQSVVKRQRYDIESEIGRALHVAVTAEDIGAVAEAADIASGEQRNAAGAHVGSMGPRIGRSRQSNVPVDSSFW